MSKTALQQIEDIAHHVPHEMLLDVHNRIADWLMGGGSGDDPYIYQQLRFAKRFVPDELEGDSNEDG